MKGIGVRLVDFGFDNHPARLGAKRFGFEWFHLTPCFGRASRLARGRDCGVNGEVAGVNLILRCFVESKQFQGVSLYRRFDIRVSMEQVGGIVFVFQCQ